jgi:hypothetical protein
MKVVTASEGMVQSIQVLQLEMFDFGVHFHKIPLVLMPHGRRKATHFIHDIYERVLSGFYFLHDDIDNVPLMEDGALVHHAHISQQWR